MNNQDITKFSATELIKLINTKKITVTELIESTIKKIQKINPQTNAFVHLNFLQMRETAKNLDEKLDNNESIGPLYGIPIGIKDIFNTKDYPTEMGSSLWKGFTSGNDARVVHYVRMNNGIIAGKTETAEFAVDALGKSLNPYDATRSPGTSSSGSAIAVATGMIPIALGTQTGASIIRPASFCGIYGFKPSFGLIPRTGMLKTADTLDQIGFFARTPQDLELFFNIIHVKGRNYPISNNVLNSESRQVVKNRPWKIKFVKSHTWDKAEDYSKTALIEFVKILSQEKYFNVSELILPKYFSDSHEMHKRLYSKSLAYYFKNELKNKKLISKIFYEFVSDTSNISLEKFDNALEYQNKITKSLDQSFESFDILISLSTAGHAPLRNKKETDDPSLIWTLCGVPAINIPNFKSPEGLPFGIQVIARKYNDKLLIQFIKFLHKLNIIKNSPYPEIK